MLAFRGGRFAPRRSFARQRRGSVRVAFAQIGAGETEIPARPFLGLWPEHREAIEDSVAEYIERLADTRTS